MDPIEFIVDCMPLGVLVSFLILMLILILGIITIHKIESTYEVKHTSQYEKNLTN